MLSLSNGGIRGEAMLDQEELDLVIGLRSNPRIYRLTRLFKEQALSRDTAELASGDGGAQLVIE